MSDWFPKLVSEAAREELSEYGFHDIIIDDNRIVYVDSDKIRLTFVEEWTDLSLYIQPVDDKVGDAGLYSILKFHGVRFSVPTGRCEEFFRKEIHRQISLLKQYGHEILTGNVEYLKEIISKADKITEQWKIEISKKDDETDDQYLGRMLTKARKAQDDGEQGEHSAIILTLMSKRLITKYNQNELYVKYGLEIKSSIKQRIQDFIKRHI